MFIHSRIVGALQQLQYYEYMSITLTTNFVGHFLYLTGGAVKTYLALQTLRRVNTCPSHSELARYMNTSKRSVATYLQELENRGYIQKKSLGAGRKTEYVLLKEPAYGKE
jgi:DNA-binding MarR family transcriptional regulator